MEYLSAFSFVLLATKRRSFWILSREENNSDAIPRYSGEIYPLPEAGSRIGVETQFIRVQSGIGNVSQVSIESRGVSVEMLNEA